MFFGGQVGLLGPIGSTTFSTLLRAVHQDLAFESSRDSISPPMSVRDSRFVFAVLFLEVVEHPNRESAVA
jgi:hypothetical protein